MNNKSIVVEEYGNLRIYQNTKGVITKIESLDRNEIWEPCPNEIKRLGICKGDILHFVSLESINAAIV